MPTKIMISDGGRLKNFIRTEEEIGQGKSSTNNQAIYQYSQDNKNDHTKPLFQFGKYVDRVTKQCDFRQAGELLLLNSSGTVSI